MKILNSIFFVLIIKFAISQQVPQLLLPIGHTTDISKVLLSNDNKYILSIDRNNTAIVWHSKIGKALYEFKFLGNNIEISSNGKFILLVNTNNQAEIKDISTGKTIKIFGAKTIDIISAKWDKNSKTILTVSKQGTAQIWNAETGKYIRSFDQEYAQTKKANWLNSRSILTNGNYVIKIWDKNTGKLILKRSSDFFSEYCYSSDKKKILIKKDSIITVININNDSTLLNINVHKKYFDFSLNQKKNIIIVSKYISDSLHYYTYDATTGKILNTNYINTELTKDIDDNGKYSFEIISNRIKVSDAKTKKYIYTLQGDVSEVETSKFSPNNNLILTNQNNLFLIWDFKKVSLYKKQFIPEYSNNLQWFDDNSLTYTGKNYFTKLDIINNKKQKLLQISDGSFLMKTPDYIKISPNGKDIAIARHNRPDVAQHWSISFKIYNINTGKFHTHIRLDDENLITIKWTTNSRWIIIKDSYIIENGGNEDYLFNEYTDIGKTNHIKFSKDNIKFIYIDNYNGNLIIKDTTNKTLCSIAGICKNKKADIPIIERSKIKFAAWNPNNKQIVAITKDGVPHIYNALTGKLFKSIKITNAEKADYSQNSEKLYIVGTDSTLYICDAYKGKVIKSFKLYIDDFKNVNYRYNLFMKKNNYSYTLYNLNTGEEILENIIIKHSDYLVKTPDNYFLATRNAINKLAYRVNGEIYSFEQFDLKYNRPDIVLSRSGYADSTLIEAYHRAYLKRIKKMGFKEEDLDGDFHIPETKIKNFEYLPVITDTSDIGLNLHFIDSKYKLDRINIWINDVAVYGTNGIDLRAANTSSIDKDIQLELAEGENKIQVSCLNQKGAESYKETVNITYKPKQHIKPNLYLVTIGTSKYKDSRFNLQYAAKDAEDVASLFTQDKYFGKVITKTLTNEQVTKENIAELKNFLKQAGRNDQVIVFVAGHGVLDANLDYYLASNDMDFNNPEKRGIPYGELESVLDGIQPLKKILFVDACHSGEIDKDEMELAEAANTEVGDVVFRSAGAGVVSKTNNLGLKNTSELTKELFTDLRRGTGATVVSSAGGGEYAMESGEWKNGLFTYSLINGIKSKEADLNKDGKIMLSELQKYVQNQVVELSGGKQQPTSRIENISMDFRVW